MKKFITTLAIVSTLGFAGVASAQTASDTTSTTGAADTAVTTSADTSGTMTATDATVGVPNTGAGGAASMNLAILATSAAAALVAGAFALRKRTE